MSEHERFMRTNYPGDNQHEGPGFWDFVVAAVIVAPLVALHISIYYAQQEEQRIEAQAHLNLPAEVRAYDLNRNGILEESELTQMIKDSVNKKDSSRKPLGY